MTRAPHGLQQRPSPSDVCRKTLRGCSACRSLYRGTKRLKSALLATLLWSAASLAQARDLYVNNLAGDDLLNGLSSTVEGDSGPVQTIARALCLAAPGDRVFLAKTEEPYREQVAIAGPRLHGFDQLPLVLDGGGATLDGTVTVAEGGWRAVGGNVFAAQPRRLRYQAMFEGGKPLQRVALLSAADAPFVLKPNQWALADRLLLVSLEKDRLPGSYELRHAGLETGITLYNTRYVVVRNLVVQGFHLDGVNAHDQARDCVLEGIDSRANGRSGLSVGGVSTLTVRESNFYDNGDSQVRVEGIAGIALTDCDIADTGARKYDVSGGELTVDGERIGP